MKIMKIAALLLIAVSMLMGCKKDSSLPSIYPLNATGGNSFKIPDSTKFVDNITNPFFSLVPGDTFYYQKVIVDGGDTTIEDICVTTTNEIKVILGVNCKVIHDQVVSGGIIIEDTYDWYAQDRRGNVWYFGEDTKKLEDDGTYSTAGSFEAGVDGAKAGIIMLGDPQAHIGQPYHQEMYVGQAEDQAVVLSMNNTITIGLGTFPGCLMTKEFTVLDPGVIANKWYAPGVGEILATTVIGGNEHEELIGTNQ